MKGLPQIVELQRVPFFSSWICTWDANKQHVRLKVRLGGLERTHPQGLRKGSACSLHTPAFVSSAGGFLAAVPPLTSLIEHFGSADDSGENILKSRELHSFPSHFAKRAVSLNLAAPEPRPLSLQGSNFSFVSRSFPPFIFQV